MHGTNDAPLVRKRVTCWSGSGGGRKEESGASFDESLRFNPVESDWLVGCVERQRVERVLCEREGGSCW